MATVDFPLGSTDTEWIIHGYTETDYLETYKENPGDIYANSDINKAMKNAFIQTRDFLMAEYDLTEYEAWTIITTGVDFATTQLVDGNWGVSTQKMFRCQVLCTFYFLPPHNTT